VDDNSADRDTIRGQILALTREAELSVEATLQDLRVRAAPDDWGSIQELMEAGGINERQTILELLAAIQPFKEEV
jgi:hypothetical protein